MKVSRIIKLLLASSVLLLSLPTFAQEILPTPTAAVTVHVVQRGENLYRIAMRYGVSIEELSRLNGITNPGSIQVGQRLLVPGDGAALPAAPLSTTHIVQPGETVESIATLYGLGVDDFIRTNAIPDTGTLYVGQVLQVELAADLLASAPQAVPEAPATDGSASADSIRTFHTVQRGETLFQIARHYAITVSELAQANNLSDSTLIYAGQQLIIPGYAPTSLTVNLPDPMVSLDILPQTLVEGQTARFHLVTRVPVTVSATFLNRPVTMIADADHIQHTSLQGVPVFTEPGIYPLELLLTNINSRAQTAVSLNLQVTAGPYGRESISLAADRGNLLDPAVEQAELDLLQRIMTIVNPTRHFDGLMSLPAAASIISQFGTRRSYNGSDFNRFHSGTDFAGAAGTPVLAAAPGQVVLADTLNVRGMSTVIDHGWGIFTGYWHQSQQYVQVGDFVTTGQVIGTIGSTGRVTGAHLHWELWAGGVPVDPMQWVRQSFN